MRDLNKKRRKERKSFQNLAASLSKTVFLLLVQSSSSCSSSKTDEYIDTSDARCSADESAQEEEVATQENTVDSSTADSSSSGSPLCPAEGTIAPLSFPENVWQLPGSFCHRLQVSPDHCTGETVTTDGDSVSQASASVFLTFYLLLLSVHLLQTTTIRTTTLSG